MILIRVTSQRVSSFTNFKTLITLEAWVNNMHSLNMPRYVSLEAGDLLADQTLPQPRSPVRHQLHLLHDQVVQLWGNREWQRLTFFTALLIIFSFGIIVHSVNVVPQSISCLRQFSTQVTRDPRKLDVRRLNVAGHVVLASHHLATSETFPDLLAHFVANLAHQCVYLRVQFFQSSVLACKT